MPLLFILSPPLTSAPQGLVYRTSALRRDWNSAPILRWCNIMCPTTYASILQILKKQFRFPMCGMEFRSFPILLSDCASYDKCSKNGTNCNSVTKAWCCTIWVNPFCQLPRQQPDKPHHHDNQCPHFAYLAHSLTSPFLFSGSSRILLMLSTMPGVETSPRKIRCRYPPSKYFPVSCATFAISHSCVCSISTSRFLISLPKSQTFAIK